MNIVGTLCASALLLFAVEPAYHANNPAGFVDMGFMAKTNRLPPADDQKAMLPGDEELDYQGEPDGSDLADEGSDVDANPDMEQAQRLPPPDEIKTGKFEPGFVDLNAVNPEATDHMFMDEVLDYAEHGERGV